MFKSNKVGPDGDGPDMTETADCVSVTCEVCIVGHSEASGLISWLREQLEALTQPALTCTVDSTATVSAYVVVLTQNSWQSTEVNQALSRAIAEGKRICMVHLPLNETRYLYCSEVADVGDVNDIRVDLGQLLGSVSEEFSNLFAEFEVLSLRREPWVVRAVTLHIIEAIGYSRRKVAAQNKKVLVDVPNYLRECIFEGVAWKGEEAMGWYQIIAYFGEEIDSGAETGTVSMEVEYLSRSCYSVPSFTTTHSLSWTKSSSSSQITIKQEGEKSWYADERWVSNTQRIHSLCQGIFDLPSQTLLLSNKYCNAYNQNIQEEARLSKLKFRYHICVLGVASEIADTAITFSHVLRERAQTSRKPRIAVLCDREPEIEADDAIVSASGMVCVFVTPSVWKDSAVARCMQTARDNNISIILMSQSDPRLNGHCIVKDTMQGAPTDVKNQDVLPFYRRSYEQSALLDHVLKQAGYTEAVVDELSLPDQWKLGSSDPAVMENKLLTYIDSWNNTSELALLQQGQWRYYEGVAGRGKQIWGWYQIDCIFNDEKEELVMLVHYQSRNPGSVPSYMSVTPFNWNADKQSFFQVDGHWRGTRDEEMNLSITNKFNDTIKHTAMPYVHHFFFSHIQREATDLCAFVTSELREVSKIGKKSRCWFDQKASEINKEGMYAGIQHSGAYVLFLSPSIWKSMYVMFELETAKKLNKTIILVHSADPASGSYTDLSTLMSQAPAEHASLLADCTVCLEYASEGEACKVFMGQLMEAGGYRDNLLDDYIPNSEEV